MSYFVCKFSKTRLWGLPVTEASQHGSKGSNSLWFRPAVTVWATSCCPHCSQLKQRPGIFPTSICVCIALSKGLSFPLAAGTTASYYHTAIDSSLSIHLFYRTGECRCSISSRCQSSPCVKSTKPKRTESRPGPGRGPPTSSWPRHALHHSPQQTHHSTTGHDDSDS